MANIEWIDVPQGEEDRISYMRFNPPAHLHQGLFEVLFGENPPENIPVVHPFDQLPVPGQPLQVETGPVEGPQGQQGLLAYLLSDQEHDTRRLCVEWLVKYFNVAVDGNNEPVHLFAFPNHYLGNHHLFPQWLAPVFYPLPGQAPPGPFIFPNGEQANLIGNFVHFNNWNNAAVPGLLLVLQECQWVWDNVHQQTPVARSISTPKDKVHVKEKQCWLEALEYFAALKAKSKTNSTKQQSVKALEEGFEKLKNDPKQSKMKDKMVALSSLIAQILGMQNYSVLKQSLERAGICLDLAMCKLFFGNTPRGSPNRRHNESLIGRAISLSNGGESAEALATWALLDARLYPVPIARANVHSLEKEDNGQMATKKRGGDFLFAPVPLKANECLDLERAILSCIIELALDAPAFKNPQSRIVFAGTSPQICLSTKFADEKRIHRTNHMASVFYNIQGRRNQKVTPENARYDLARVSEILQAYGSCEEESALDFLVKMYHSAGKQPPLWGPPETRVTASKASTSFALSTMEKFLPESAPGHCPVSRKVRREGLVQRDVEQPGIFKPPLTQQSAPGHRALAKKDSRGKGLMGKGDVRVVSKVLPELLEKGIKLPGVFANTESGRQLASLLTNRLLLYDCLSCSFAAMDESSEVPAAETGTSTVLTSSVVDQTNFIPELKWKSALTQSILQQAVQAQQSLFNQGICIFPPLAKMIKTLRQTLKKSKLLGQSFLVEVRLAQPLLLELQLFRYDDDGPRGPREKNAESSTKHLLPKYWYGEQECHQAFWNCSPAYHRIGSGLQDQDLKFRFRRSILEGLKTRELLRSQSMYSHGTANKWTFREHRNGSDQGTDATEFLAYLAPDKELFQGDPTSFELFKRCLPVATYNGDSWVYQSFRALVLDESGFIIRRVFEREAYKTSQKFEKAALICAGSIEKKRESTAKLASQVHRLSEKNGAPNFKRPAVRRQTKAFRDPFPSVQQGKHSAGSAAPGENSSSNRFSVLAYDDNDDDGGKISLAYCLNAVEKATALPPHLVERRVDDEKEHFLVPQPRLPKKNQTETDKATPTKEHFFTKVKQLAGPKHSLKR